MNGQITQAALFYSWRELARRAGVAEKYSTGHGFESLSVAIHYDRPDAIQVKPPGIVVVPCAENSWSDLLNRPNHSLDWLSPEQVLPAGASVPFSGSIPVLFWGEGYEDGHKSFAECLGNKTIVFYADILAATLFMLSRWEEMVVSERDEHLRFPATASVAYKQGFLGRPIVDEYALILQAWLKTLMPSWSPSSPQFSVKLSHDVDSVRSASFRMLGGDLLKRRNLSKALQTVYQILSPKRDVYLSDCYELANLSEQNGLQSAFYFMSAQKSRMDDGYDPQARQIQRLIQDLRQKGCEIGFHAGYAAYNDLECLMPEKFRMDKALGEKRYGGRQHFLRFQIPNTWRLWEQAGLVYDSTLGYADYEGFRCGTCHPYQPFDIEQNCQINLLEIPLIVMDGTLRQYQALTPEEGERRILTLARRCKQVGGMFTLLWHNSSLHDEWEPWITMYRRMLPRLVELV